jgi:transcriptional regulator with XRE-family HTH domain
MGIDILEIAGYDPSDPEIIAAGEDFEEFADLITELHRVRKAQGITQKQVAKSMETKQSAVSEIERIGGNPTIRTLLSFSRAVGMRLRLVAEPAPIAPESTEQASRIDDTLDGLLAEARRLTGINDNSAVVSTALTYLIERESGQRLAQLGGSQPEVVNVRRRRQSRTG